MVLVHSPSTIAVPRFESIAHIKKGRAFWPIRRPERVLAGQFDTADWSLTRLTCFICFDLAENQGGEKDELAPFLMKP